MLVVVLALLTLAPRPSVAPAMCNDPLACMDACEKGIGAACSFAAEDMLLSESQKALSAQWLRKGCTLGDVGSCAAYTAYVEEHRGTQAALDVIGPHCTRGARQACDAVTRLLVSADDATRARWVPLVARACGEACEEIATTMSQIGEAWTAPLLAATRARCEAGGPLKRCVDVFRLLDPRTAGRSFYAKLSERAVQACRAGDLDGCRFFDFTESQSKRIGISAADLGAARAEALHAARALCAVQVDYSFDDDDACWIASRLAGVDVRHAACDDGDARACVQASRLDAACRLGDQASCIEGWFSVFGEPDAADQRAACQAGIRAREGEARLSETCRE
jgi:hypothetical protein